MTLLLNNNNKEKRKKNFLKGRVLGDKEQGIGIRDKGQGSKDKWSSTLKTKQTKRTKPYIEAACRLKIVLSVVFRGINWGLDPWLKISPPKKKLSLLIAA